MAIVNARVWTGDPSRPWAEAVAVAGDRIAAVGSSASIRKMLPTGARVVDARRGLLTPGFIDAHIHFIEGGQRLSWVQLAGASDRKEFARRVAAFVKDLPPGMWIRGGDWDHENWGGVLPERSWIDAVTPANPVWVTRHDGHMGLANSAALRMAGIDAATSEPDGGSIVRDSAGSPTGVLKDRAMEFVSSALPADGEASLDAALRAAMQYVAARGVTSVHNMGTWENLAVFRRAHERRQLTTRVYAAVPLATWERLRDEVESHGRGDSWLGIGALKAFVDGSLGSHTALFHADYSDAPGERGLLFTPQEELLELLLGADGSGLHCITHAIGDRAITILLDAYEEVARRHGPRDRRFRVEHAQHLRPRDLPRFARQGVIASMQPYHASDDGRWAERVIGSDRARMAFPIRSILDTGATVALGSDWFVAPPSPVAGIDAAVTRRTLDGLHPDGWIPTERITVEQALIGYTRAAAFAGFQEAQLGSIEPGKLADLVLLDRDVTTIAPEEIGATGVVMTVVDGRIVFENPRFAPG